MYILKAAHDTLIKMETTQCTLFCAFAAVQPNWPSRKMHSGNLAISHSMHDTTRYYSHAKTAVAGKY